MWKIIPTVRVILSKKSIGKQNYGGKIMKVRGISVFNEKTIEVEIKEGFIKNINTLPGSGHNLPYISPGFFDLQVMALKGAIIV